MSKLKALMEKRASLQSEMRAISDKLETETRAWTEDEKALFDKAQAEVKALTETIEAIQASRDLEDAEVVEDETRSKANEEERENRAFAHFIRATLDTSRKEDRADVNLTFSANSNAIVPKTIAKKIVAKIYDISPVVEKANKYITKGTLEIPVYGADEEGNDINVAYATEFQELEARIGAFDSVELQNHLIGALAKLSNSLINNTDLDIVNFVIDRLGYEFARFLEHEMLIGTNGKIQGLRSIVASRVMTSAVTGVVDADDLIDLKNMVKKAHRKNALWVMSTDTKSDIEKLKDENGRYLFSEDLTGEFDGKVLGYPAYVSDSMPNATAGAKAIAFGDFSGLALKWSEQLEIKVLREKYATQHATGIVAWAEGDSKVEDNDKLAVLQVKTA